MERSMLNKKYASSWLLMVFILLISVLAILFITLKPSIIGFTTAENEFSFNDTIDTEFTSSSEYAWQIDNLGNVKSIKLFGQFQNGTSARIYVENDGVKYLILDTTKIDAALSSQKITGFVVKEDKEKDKEVSVNKTQSSDEALYNVTAPNETITNQPLINETITNQPLINETITINLAYKQNTPYDEDNDGIEPITNVIDFTVENSSFNWEADYSKVCTRWEVYSIDLNKATTVCYGDNECCAMIDLLPKRGSWNEPFYIAYNSFGAAYNNIVSAQVIYNNNSGILTSSWANLSAKFKEELLGFENACVETCALFGFNKSSYNIIVEVDNGKIILNKINYAVEQLKNKASGLISDINNYSLNQRDNLIINLSDYFSNIDDKTTFTYFEQEGINIMFGNGTATIVPAQDFMGTAYTFITANKSDSIVISNVFSITVTDITVNKTITAKITPVLTLKKKDFKFDEDIDLDFEYLTKPELIKENKWKEGYEVYEEITEKTAEELDLLKTKIIKKEKQIKKHVKENEIVETSLFDSGGNLKDINVEIEELREGKFDIKIPKQRAFRAGKYTLKIDLIKDGVAYSQEQDFTWGVLAVNVNKSIYLPNENAFIGIGVLDDNGRVVCNADVTLEITNPLNEKTALTTANGDIKISPECTYLGVTLLPDYYTTYSVDGVGNYVMNLTAITANGERSILNNFTVQSSVAFDVARQGPTRIYPPVPYVMNISIIANKNYNGIINEYVPAGFEVSNVEIYEITQEEITLSSAEDTGTSNKVSESLSEIALSAVENVDAQSARAIPSSPIIQVLPFISSENFSRNCITNGSSLDHTGGCTRITTIAGNFDGGNNEVFKKSLSRVNIALDSLQAEKYSLEFLMPFLVYFISTPLSESDLINLASTSSSAKNLSFDMDKSFTSQSFSSVMQSGLNVLLSQRWVSFNDIVKTLSSFKQFQNRVDHNPSAFESGLSMANFAVSNNILINFGSHRINNGKGVFKAYENQEINNNQNSIKNNIADFFTLIPSASAQASNQPNDITITTINDTKIISVPANLKEGSKYVLSYKFDAPDTSPEFYVLGPLEIGLFKEARQWQIANDAEVAIDAAILDSTDEYNMGPNVVFINDTYGYVFYVDGSSDVVYQKTIDGGAAWSGLTALSPDKVWANVVVWYDQWTPGDTTGTKIHIAAVETGTDDVWYHSLDTNGDTLDASGWVAAILSTRYDAAADGAPAITKSTDGFLFAGMFGTIGVVSGEVWKSIDSGDTWSKIAGTTEGLDDDNDEMQLLPLSGGDVLMIMKDITANVIQSKVWDEATDAWDGAFALSATLTDSATYDVESGAALNKATGNVYLAFNNAPALDSTTNDLEVWKYTESTRTWGQLTNALDNSESFQGTMAIDANTGDLYVVYSLGNGAADAADDTDIFYKKSALEYFQ